MLKGAGKLTERVYDFCIEQGLLRRGMKVIAGVSGGADSVCLLRMLDEMKEALDLTIICVHIEHGIRGEESRADRDFVRDLCAEMGIELKIYEEDVPGIAKERSMTLEEAGRCVRYEAFKKEFAKKGADAIAVAHHRGDQAETVLFNMIRGSGLKGISGMTAKNGSIIRPLLILSREDIEEYLRDMGQDFRIDSTNADEGYSRNALRNCIIPELRRIAAGADEHIVRAADEAREADDYLRSQAAPVYKRAVSGKGDLYRVDIDKLAGEPGIIVRYVLRSLLTNIYTSHKDLEALHVRSLADLCYKQSGRCLSLPRGMGARKEGNYLLVGRIFGTESECEDINMALNTGGESPVPGYGSFYTRLEEWDGTGDIPDSHYTKWFDYDKIVNGVRIRTRMTGDYLTIGEDEKKKKLKNYLIDEKVPSSERDHKLVLADGSHIIWIVGMRISQHYKISKETRRILKIEYKEMQYGR